MKNCFHILLFLMSMHFISAFLPFAEAENFPLTNENRGMATHHEIYGDVTLTKEDSPYIFQDDIVVPSGSSLSAEPGVEIRMPLAKSIYVYGTLNIIGTVEEPVYLTSHSDVQRWGCISAENAENPVVITHAVIENAFETEGNNLLNAAVSGISSDIVLSHVLFENVMQAITVNQGSLKTEKCIFSNSNTGEQIHVVDATAIIDGCVFLGVTGGDAIDFEGVVDGLITGCEIYSSEDDGIDIGNTSTNITISDTRIFNCFDKGISVGQGSDVTVKGVVIADAFIGAAIFDNSIGAFDHITFHDNDTALSCYGKISGNNGGICTLTNSILSGSHSSDLSIDKKSSLTVTYTISDTELIDGFGNIQADPLFVDTESRDYSLSPDSPCINNGDPQSDPDPDGTRADMGAHYYPITPLVITEINYNSSPDFNAGDWIEIHNPTQSSIDLSGWVFRDDDIDHTMFFADGLTIEPEEYIVISGDSLAFSTVFPNVASPVGYFNFGLNGNGELIRLYDNHGAIVDSLTFSDSEPWPTASDGEGPTLSLIDPALDNSDPASWDDSDSHGTPGGKNEFNVHVDEPMMHDFPKQLILGQNYPNPFNQSTTIPFYVPEDGHVTIEVYSVLGQLITKIVDSFKREGYHQTVFNAEQYAGGILFYTITVNDIQKTKRMMYAK